MKAFWITPRAIIITIAVLVLWFVGYNVFAKEPVKQEQQVDFDTTFRNHWAKAGEYKLQEIKHSDNARDFEAKARFEKEEAEKARIEKEKLLFWTGTSLGKIQ